MYYYVCSNYAVEHDITFNCSKSVGVLFLPKYLSLSNVPKVFLCNNAVKFKNNVSIWVFFLIIILKMMMIFVGKFVIYKKIISTKSNFFKMFPYYKKYTI